MATGVWGLAECQEGLAILSGLAFKPGKGAALFFASTTPRACPHIQKIVSFTESRVHREFTDGNAESGGRVHVCFLDCSTQQRFTG
jgi:hypothetical protein